MGAPEPPAPERPGAEPAVSRHPGPENSGPEHPGPEQTPAERPGPHPSGPDAPLIVLHLGAHRTASTRLQVDLAMLRRRKRVGGAAILLPDDTRAGLTRAVNIAARLGPGAGPAARLLGLRGLDWPDAPRIVVSDENLLGPLDAPVCGAAGLYRAAPRLAALRVLLPPRPVRAVLAVRSYDTWYPSAWSRVLMRRAVPSAQSLRQAWLARKPLWPALVGDILAAFGTCTVVRYESFLDDRRALLRPILGAAAEGAQRLPAGRVLPGLSQAAMAEIAARRAAGETVDLGRAKDIAAAHAGTPPPASPLSAQEAARMRAWYAEDIAAIAAMPGVTLV